MKKITFTLILILIGLFSYAQKYLTEEHFSAFIEFDTATNLIIFDTTQANNIWQIGPPQKTIFNSAYSQPNALMTDTVNYYPINNNSSFKIKIESDSNDMWGFAFVNFYHKYDFDSINDGGYIEIKYSDDTTWTNIVYDTIIMGNYPLYQNCYTKDDTIIGGIPAFTGTLNTWEEVNIELLWLVAIKDIWDDPFLDSVSFRFSIKTDSLQTNNEGWMIDDMYIVLFDPGGNLNENGLNVFNAKLYPNPATRNAKLEFDNPKNTETIINIYNISGSLLKSYSTRENNIEFDVREYGKGTFIYQITQDSEIKSSGKFLIQ